MAVTPAPTVAGTILGPDTHANRPDPDASGLPVGAVFVCSDHDTIYQTDGSSRSDWATLGSLADQGAVTYLDLTEAAAPATPASGTVRWYATTDGSIASKDDAGSETVHGAGSPSFVGAKASNDGTQSLSDDLDTAVTFDTEDFDTDSFHSTSTNTSRFTVPAGKAGRYRVDASVFFAADAAGNRMVTFHVNGAVVGSKAGFPSPDATNATVVKNSDVFVLAAGDYIEVYALQSSGGSLDIGHASTRKNRCQMSIEYLGA